MTAFKKHRGSILFAACFSMTAFSVVGVSAQLINVGIPFRSAGDSYYERNGVAFGLNFRGNGRIVGLNPAGQITPNIAITQGSFGGGIGLRYYFR